MAKLYNLARMSVSGTPGAGSITVGTNVNGYLNFAAAGLVAGQSFTYAINDGASSEIGRGTAIGSPVTSFSRDTVLASTASGSKITVSSQAQVEITAAAEDFIHLDVANTWTATQGFTSGINVVGAVQISGNGATNLQYFKNDNGTDQKYFEIVEFDTSGTIHFRTVNDAYNASEDFMTVARQSGTYLIGGVTFPPAVTMGNGLNVSGNAVVSNTVAANLVQAGTLSSFVGTGVGYSTVDAGTIANAGYFAWFDPTNTRIGYMGFDPNNITIQLEKTNSQFIVDGGQSVFNGAVLVPSGSFGVGLGSGVFPAFQLQVKASDGTNALISGATKGVRIVTDTAGGRVEGVDNTGTGSFQPLTLNGTQIYIGSSAASLTFETANSYLNFNNTVGSAGYGIRDNEGTMQFKSSGGSWLDLGATRIDAVTKFGFVGDDSTDNNTAMTALVTYANTAGNGTEFFFRPGKYRDSGTHTITATNIKFVGSGQSFSGTGTWLRHTGTSGDYLTFSGSDACTVERIMFSPVNHKTSGAEVRATSQANSTIIRECGFKYTFIPVSITGANTVKVIDCYVQFVFGQAGVFCQGPNAASVNNIIILEDVTFNNNYPYSGGPPPSNSNPSRAKVRAVSHAYALGDCIFETTNSFCWQCTTAGTSGSGAFPAAPTYTLATDPWTMTVTDGTAHWSYLCNDSLAWLNMDSFTQSLSIRHPIFIGGFNAIKMQDSLNTGSSAPSFIFGWDVEVDYPFADGVLLLKGDDVYLSGSYLCTSLSGLGVNNVGATNVNIGLSRLAFNNAAELTGVVTDNMAGTITSTGNILLI